MIVFFTQNIYYRAIRSIEELRAISDFSKNYVVASDIKSVSSEDEKERCTIIKDDEAFNGKFDGNNYNFDLGEQSLVYECSKDSIVENIIFASNEARGRGGLIAYKSAGLIKNCTNKINIKAQRPVTLLTAGGLSHEEKKTNITENCINYGEIKININIMDSGFYGFTGGGVFDNCYNVGEIRAQKEVFIFGSTIEKVSNCANLAEITSSRVAFCKAHLGNWGTNIVFYNKNYAKLNFETLTPTMNRSNDPNNYVFIYKGYLTGCKNCVNLGKINRYENTIDPNETW